MCKNQRKNEFKDVIYADSYNLYPVAAYHTNDKQKYSQAVLIEGYNKLKKKIKDENRMATVDEQNTLFLIKAEINKPYVNGGEKYAR